MARKIVTANGMIKDINDNFERLDSLCSLEFTFDVEAEDSAGELNSAVGAHGVDVSLPAHAIVVGGFYDVNTPFTSENTNNATIAIHIESANDIVTATAVSNAIYGTKGRKAIVPKFNTPESTSIKTTVEREVTCTVATSALLTGKLTGYLFYIEGIESADLPASA